MSTADELYDAIEVGDPETVAQLLDDDPELLESVGVTPPPIHWAIFHDQLRIVEALIAAGANIERRDPDRDATPLAYAIVYGRSNIAQLLLDRGAAVEGMRDLALRGAAGDFEQYPDVASRKQFAELAKLIPHE